MHDRFWSKVDTSGGLDACWPWTAFRQRSGYGRFRLNGRLEGSHRVVATLAFGPLPLDAHVCHHCDNPPCCNPLHIYVGSAKTNGADKARRRRAVAPNKISPEVEDRIRALDGFGAEWVARQVGVSPNTVRRVRAR